MVTICWLKRASHRNSRGGSIIVGLFSLDEPTENPTLEADQIEE